MSLTVRYSLRARHEEMGLLEYVIRDLGQQKAKEIYDGIGKTLEQISESPEIYRESKSEKMFIQ
ncbi:hypothetical protein [Lunatibacter salilacus]|uniref:hypothetical protein n=1 Tax=Lunatibacter salilacus TaxID=2483804 RepID=UPI00131CFBC0|nr:hypothetical protein [Lunatibacter salilacus]